MFLSRKSIAPAAVEVPRSTIRSFQDQDTPPDDRKSLLSEAVAGRSAGLRGLKQRAKAGPREGSSLRRLGHQPAVQGPPPDRPRAPAQAPQQKPSGPRKRAAGIHPSLKGLIVLIQQFARPGCSGKGVPPRRRGPCRNHLCPKPVAEVERLGIGRILAPRNAAGSQGTGNVALAEVEQRPQAQNNRPLHVTPIPGRRPTVWAKVMRADRTRRSKPTRPASARQAHENGFGDVVLLLAEEYRPQAEPCARGVHESHPGFARRRFTRGGGAAFPPPAPRPQHKGNAQPAGDLVAEKCVAPGGLPPQPMIKMHRDDPLAGLRPMRPDEQQ
jgi:hypothetical protein